MVAVQLDLFEDNSEHSLSMKMIGSLDGLIRNVQRGAFQRITHLQSRCLQLEEHCDRLERRLSRLERERKRPSPKQSKEDKYTILVEGF